MTDLTHIDPSGGARMVDVGAKAETARAASAAGTIVMQRATLDAIRSNQLKKGDVIAVARVAGIMAAKRTSEIIPLCHPIALTDLTIDIDADESLPGMRVEATARTIGRTGVEMEALSAVAAALLTVYDMAKSLDRGMTITGIGLLEKSGGASGTYQSAWMKGSGAKSVAPPPDSPPRR